MHSLGFETWAPWFAFTDYPGPWYMSEWAWASATCLLALYWLKGDGRSSAQNRRFP